MTGVYILMSDKEVIYVGATENWPNRLAQHKEIPFTNARLFKCDSKDLLEFEARFIKFFKPKNNYMGNQKSRRKITEQWVKDNGDLIKKCVELDTKGSNNELADKARLDLGLSPKYTTTDICRTLRVKYQKAFFVGWDYKKSKFKSKKIKSGERPAHADMAERICTNETGTLDGFTGLTFRE